MSPCCTLARFSLFIISSLSSQHIFSFCLLVGDSHSIKKAKEVINELLNLDPPASNATSASAQSKNAPKLKPKPKPQLVKKLPPMPTEPKPVGQVSRFSLLIPGDSKDDEISEDSTHGDSDLETNQKDDWLPRETKTNSKKKTDYFFPSKI